MSDDEAEVVTLEIRLRRVIRQDGAMAWRFEASDDANCLDMLGLLETGKAYIFEKMRRDERDY